MWSVYHEVVFRSVVISSLLIPWLYRDSDQQTCSIVTHDITHCNISVEIIDRMAYGLEQPVLDKGLILFVGMCSGLLKGVVFSYGVTGSVHRAAEW